MERHVQRCAQTWAKRHQRAIPWLAALCLAILCGLAYSNAAPPEFVYDDIHLISENRGFGGIETVPRLFGQHAWAGTTTASHLYRPLSMATLAVDRSLHGHNARGYHLTSILLHIAATLVLYGFLLTILGGGSPSPTASAATLQPASGHAQPHARTHAGPHAGPHARTGSGTRGHTPADSHAGSGAPAVAAAWLAALVFGLHPIHTEAVDVVFNRSELLATIWVVAALWLLWRQVDRRPLAAWAGASLLYLAALLCRESAATLPALWVLLCIFWPPGAPASATIADRTKGQRSRFWHRALPAVVLLLPLLAYLGLRHLALDSQATSSDLPPSLGNAASASAASNSAAVPPSVAIPPSAVPARSAASPAAATARLSLGHLFGQRLGLLAVTVRDYLRMIVWPHPLRATYEDYAVHGLVLALLVHAGMLATVVLTRRRAPWLGLGIAFFYVALLPSSKLFAAPAVLAERFVYLPSAGLAILLAFGLRALWRRCGQRWPVLAAVVAVFSLAVLLPLTMRRNAEWRSVFSLWEAEARHGGDDWRMLHNVSTAYVEQGKFPQALAACQRGLRLAPDYRPLHTNCGVALQALERFAEANATLQRAVDLPGSGSRELGNLARFYVGRGRLAEADALFRRAIAAQQDPALRRLLVGERLLLVAGNAAAALPELEAAVQALPPHPRARRLLERARQEQAAGKGVSLPHY